MNLLTLLEPPVREDDLTTGISALHRDEPLNSEPLREVLDWVRASGQKDTGAIDKVAGVTDEQAAHLARLSALIVTTMDATSVPATLVEALQPANTIPVPDNMRAAFQRLLAGDPITSLAAVYAHTVAASNRRVLGTFFTPRAEATAMVHRYAQKFADPAQVVDIGAGVGVFSDAARTQWADAAVDAVDINPVTLGLQATALSAIGNRSTSLFLDDFADWVARFAPDGPTLYLGNPPYTRWQLIPVVDRERLLEAAGGLVGARANLSTIFLAIALRKLRPQDALCLIVPASWMSARYAERLRAFVREQRSRPVTLRFADSWRFDNAIVDAVVVEIGPETQTTHPLLITDWPGDIVVEQKRLPADQSPFARLTDVDPDLVRMPRQHCDRLGDIAHITRGVATGANKFFALTAEEAATRGIKERWLTPLARRIRVGDTSSAPLVETAFLLTLGQYRAGDDAELDRCIKEAEKQGIDRGYLCGLRHRWFDLSSETRQPDVIFTSLGRDRFHFYINAESFTITNNLFGLEWRDGVQDWQKEHALSWLRSGDGQRALFRSSAREANGLHRLSPRAMRDILVPRQEGQAIDLAPNTTHQLGETHADS